MHPRFGDLIRESRKKLGLRQLDLARKVGLCRISIIRIEEGTIVPRYDQMLRIAEVLRLPITRVAV